MSLHQLDLKTSSLMAKINLEAPGFDKEEECVEETMMISLVLLR